MRIGAEVHATACLKAYLINLDRSQDRLAARKIFRAMSGTPGSAGYIIARSAAAWLTETPPALHCGVDVFLFKPKISSVAKRLKRYQIVPALCVQDEVLEKSPADQSLIKTRNTRGRGYRERLNPLLRLWPISRHAVPFRA